MRLYSTLSALFFLLLAPTVFGQQFVPGQVYFDSASYVEYQAGNLPIILGAPHGGYLEPDTIPDRDCSGCVYGRDLYTQELTRSIAQELEARTGCTPHVVINLLHRKKLDANRSITTAADGNPLAEQSWNAYHGFLDSASAAVEAEFGQGLFVDMHGHGHTIQRLELGYLLDDPELQVPDDSLNTTTWIEESSIKHLAGSNINGYTHAQLIRGNESFGTLIADQSYPAVPSSQDSFPLPGEPFFSGGYSTRRHGSRDGGTVDGIQIECNQDVRFDPVLREAFADSLTTVILDYLETHYFPAFPSMWCLPPDGIADHTTRSWLVYPNPAHKQVTISAPWSNHRNFSVEVMDQTGRMLKQEQLHELPAQLNLEGISPGLVWLIIKTPEGIVSRNRLVVR